MFPFKLSTSFQVIFLAKGLVFDWYQTIVAPYRLTYKLEWLLAAQAVELYPIDLTISPQNHLGVDVSPSVEARPPVPFLYWEWGFGKRIRSLYFYPSLGCRWPFLVLRSFATHLLVVAFLVRDVDNNCSCLIVPWSVLCRKLQSSLVVTWLAAHP